MHPENNLTRRQALASLLAAAIAPALPIPIPREKTGRSRAETDPLPCLGAHYPYKNLIPVFEESALILPVFHKDSPVLKLLRVKYITAPRTMKGFVK